MFRRPLEVECPHCGESFDVAVRIEAGAVPPAPHFGDADALVAWLRASGFTVDELQQLPFYAWHEEELAPLVRALTERQRDRLRAA